MDTSDRSLEAGLRSSLTSFGEILVIICVLNSLAVENRAEIANGHMKRSVSVADVIQMTRLSTNDYYGAATPTDNVAQISPDGSTVLVVVKKGDLQNNTNEYSILLWRAQDLLHSSAPERVLTISSSSNREAIKDITWLDNETIAFLGENPGELTQVYRLNTRTRVMSKITNHPSAVVAYSVTPRLHLVAYIAKAPRRSIWDNEAQHRGLRVSGQDLIQLITGETDGDHNELFYQAGRLGSPPKKSSIVLSTVGGTGSWNQGMSVSPNGRYLAVFDIIPEKVPETWKEYTDPNIKENVDEHNGGHPGLQRYSLVETSTGQVRTLLNSPIRPGFGGSEAAWSADSNSLVITDTYLPLEGTSGEERKERQSTSFAVEISIPTGQITKITHDDLRLLAWNPKSGRLEFELGRIASKRDSEGKVLFQKEGGAWKPVSRDKQEGALTVPVIALEEDLNTPPRIVAKDPRSGKEISMLDLNPQFTTLEFGKVEQIEWGTANGQVQKGRLYYPVQYVPANRYPLVIQTHGYNQPDRFEIDGPFTTAFAAQPLAGKGFMVLETQIGDTPAQETPKEADEATAIYEGAIDYLNRTGLIDPSRIGIIGFSRTCFHVKAALTTSRYHFAAASVTDGVDGSYFQYIAFQDLQHFSERVNGGTPPFGDGLKSWLQYSPGFHIDSATTPLLITALDSGSLLGEWEWFSALRRLHRPVEMIYLRDGSHALERPWDRMVSQQGTVDWFAFWLKGDEDPDPQKKEQYQRWEQMRQHR
jgi:dipeptidyl aminopeptidase/acylaminoacyl peptidase